MLKHYMLVENLRFYSKIVFNLWKTLTWKKNFNGRFRISSIKLFKTTCFYPNNKIYFFCKMSTSV